MNIEPIEALGLRQQIDDVEERLEKLEKQLAMDEFISAGFFRRGLVVVGYWLMGAATCAGVVWVVNTIWGWM
jgi:hypothetical protein